MYVIIYLIFKRQHNQKGYCIFNTFYVIMDTQFSVVACFIINILAVLTVPKVGNDIALFYVGDLFRCVLERVWIFGSVKY